jgi:hypothetical protein
MYKMKHSIAALAILGTALFSSGAAHADLTIQGAKGLPLNPTAELPQGTVLEGSLIDLGNLRVSDPFGGVPGTFDAGDFHFYGIHAATRQSSRLEINGGVDHLKADNNRINTLVDTGFPFGLQPGTATPNFDDLNETGLSLGAKFLLKKGATPQDVSIALGGGFSSALVNNGYAYLVGSKGFGDMGEGRSRLKLHLGVRYDRFRTDEITARVETGFGSGTPNFGRFKSSKVSVYGGAEYQIGRDYALIGEIQSKNNDFESDVTGDLNNDVKTPFSVALRYAPKDERGTLTVGAARQGLTGDKGYFVQLGYKFGG